MNDNFDLRKFLVESKAIENMNPIFRKLNENAENTTAETTETTEATTTTITENTLRAKIREMVLAELALTEETDGYESMSDSELISYAENDGLEELIVMDGEGGLANRNEIIQALKSHEMNEDVNLDEAKKKEEDVEDVPADDAELDLDMEMDTEPTTPEDELNVAAAGATGDSKEMIDHLMKALDNAKTSGNEKLVTQVLNTLKFAIDQSIVD